MLHQKHQVFSADEKI